MSKSSELIRDIGEKRLIREIVRPMLNPEGDTNSIGDDCALLEIPPGATVCASTDRVPADLVSFRLGILDYEGLGNYLAVLNLSDLAAMGATPAGLLLNLGLPATVTVKEFRALLRGARDACAAVGCRIVGGDLSSASELSISATSIGMIEKGEALRRSGARVGDLVYCSDTIGLAPTAFAYFLRALPDGFRLKESQEEVLKDCFRKPVARFQIGHALARSGLRVTAMDNTDGLAQSLSEIGEQAGVGICLRRDDLPLHEITYEVAGALSEDAAALALGPGADFQLVGTIEERADTDRMIRDGTHIIGHVVREQGLYIEEEGTLRELEVRGWNYYAPIETHHVENLSGNGHK